MLIRPSPAENLRLYFGQIAHPDWVTPTIRSKDCEVLRVDGTLKMTLRAVARDVSVEK
jgi:hypothetical protein